jgi:hypothetical protein
MTTNGDTDAAHEAEQQPDGTFKVRASAPTEVPDGDYTSEFLEAGTTFTIGGAINSDPIPVEKAWVENGKLHMEGTARWGS